MKTVKDKQILMAADFAGCPLKEAIKEYLEKKGGPDFDKFHQIAIDELNAFNYEEYKANGFKVKHLGDCHCELYDRPEGFSSVPLMCKR